MGLRRPAGGSAVRSGEPGRSGRPGPKQPGLHERRQRGTLLKFLTFSFLIFFYLVLNIFAQFKTFKCILFLYAI